MITIHNNVELRSFTTIKCGGPAKHLVECKTEQEIIAALEYAESKNLPLFILGGGSNSLISDKGFDGLVLKVADTGFQINSDGIVTAKAGVIWDSLVAECCTRGWTGIEALSGIPGSVGATPVQNVGAYGQEVADTIQSLKAIHRKSKITRIFTPAECEFSYRNSRFKVREKDQWIITEVLFKLSPSITPEPKYEELKQALAKNQHWTVGDRFEKIAALRDQVIRIRASKGMVLNPSDPDTNSLGSFFMNPLVSQEIKDQICAIGKSRGQPPPAHPVGENLWKISAAWLIENSGIHRGLLQGGAKISTKHVLAITNPGNATTRDILELADYIEAKVHSTFAVKLEREPVYVE